MRTIQRGWVSFAIASSCRFRTPHSAARNEQQTNCSHPVASFSIDSLQFRLPIPSSIPRNCHSRVFHLRLSGSLWLRNCALLCRPHQGVWYLLYSLDTSRKHWKKHRFLYARPGPVDTLIANAGTRLSFPSMETKLPTTLLHPLPLPL